MNKSKFSFAALCALVAFFSFSCNKKTLLEEQTSETKIEEKNVVISLGFSTNMEDPRGVASLFFKNEVEEKSGGRIKIEIFPNGELGGDAELIEGVMSGKLDMTVSSAGNFATYATKVGISAMPFLFSEFEDAWHFMDSELVTDVNKTLEEFGIIVLSHYDNGFRCVTTTSRPINSVSDMQNLKIRTPPNQIVMETMLALGASPKPYAFNELKAALKSGLFDSEENPIPVIFNSRLFEEQKYLAITNHSYDAMPLVIRKTLWETFSAEEKSILLEAAKKAQTLNRNLVKEQTESYVSKLKEEGMIITMPDLKPFQNATSGVMDVFGNIYGDRLISKVKDLTGE
ncbi:TRAP transporter substrate-binding protein [Treponema zioleckii]|uniref:TRAP transporter substrate-binding protein n=1 Tax=Treponema zioleckii TaxID=331680 RepID=UPI00168BCC49|nr:TRAP transporter substrate-binding protein [Treponema zioleckii]